MSRRTVLAGAGVALAVVGGVSALAGPARGRAAPSGGRLYAYVGCYTSVERSGRGQGISVYRVGDDHEWRLVQIAPAAPNPSYLVVDNAGHTLYSVHGDGSLVSFYRIDSPSGRLRALGSQDTGGRNGVHLALSPDERFVLVANYATGSVAGFPRNADGTLGPRRQLLALTGAPGPVASEQKGPQPHEISFDSTGRHVLVPDKGTDRVHRMSFDPASGDVAVLGDPVPAPAGSGPRHLVHHPSLPLLYLVDELSSQLTVYQYDAQTAAMVPAQVMSTLPDDFNGTSTAAEIVVAGDGRHLYVSNRGHDSIATFGLTPAGVPLSPGFTLAGGQQPRFVTLDPDQTLLYAANQKSDSIVGLFVDPATGRLSPGGPAVATNSPSSIAFATLMP